MGGGHQGTRELDALLEWRGRQKTAMYHERGLAMQRTSPATPSAGDAEAQPPSTQLLTHDLPHPATSCPTHLP